MPKVSIVLPTFNGSKYIAESLTSIINQTFTDWELIIINDCSTDNTPDIINDFSSKDKRIKVFTNKTNLKLPRSLNEGFKHASGMYYTWTSDDNRYKTNALKEMVSVLDNNQNIGLIYCNTDIIDEHGEVIGQSNLPLPENLINQNVIGACFMYRADIAKKIGGYEPDFFLAEDYEYWLRFFLNSEIYKHNLNLYEYRLHSKSLTAASRERQILIQRARVKHKYLNDFIKKITDPIVLHGLYFDLLSNDIVLTKNEIRLFKSKDKHIKRWYKRFILYKTYPVIGHLLYKKINFDLPEGIVNFIITPLPFFTKFGNIVTIKKLIKYLLPYGLVRFIQNRRAQT